MCVESIERGKKTCPNVFLTVCLVFLSMQLDLLSLQYNHRCVEPYPIPAFLYWFGRFYFPK